METLHFIYNESTIDFSKSQNSLMVNATQMAKHFGREMKHFNELDSTQKFIETCIISRDSRLIGIEKKEDILLSKRNSGTWVHRILALKAATAQLRFEFNQKQQSK